MVHREFQEKFVAFVDIIGFDALVREAEQGRGLSVPEINSLLEELGTEENQKEFVKYGPITCPGAPWIRIQRKAI